MIITVNKYLLNKFKFASLLYGAVIFVVIANFVFSVLVERQLITSGLSDSLVKSGVDHAEALAQTEEVSRKIFVNSLARFFIELMVGLFFAQIVASAFKIVKDKLKELSKNNIDMSEKSPADGEMGVLMDILQPVFEKIRLYKNQIDEYRDKFYQETLDKSKKIEHKLNSVSKDKEELERQREAMLKVLEEINISQEELKVTNAVLEKKQKELVSLKALSDELNGAEDLESAVATINKHIAENIGITAASYLIVNPAEEGGVVYMTFLKDSVSEKYVAEIEKDLRSFFQNHNQENSDMIIKVLTVVKPHIFGQKLDNDREEKLMSKIILPLCLGEKLIGLVHLSSSKIDFSNVKTESEYMDAMMATFSMSVSRLQSLILSQHSRTESLVKSLNDGVIMFSNEKKIILMNPMATSQIGLTIEGASIGDISKLFGAHNLEDEMDRTLLSGEAFRINKVSIAEYYYEAIIAPVKDNDGRIAGCSLIMHDITYLEEVDRMKTEFVSVASHQLRTPLTAIKLFTDMLLKGEVGKLNAEQVEYLNHIYQSTDSMVILVYDLLNVTRIESGKLIINPQPTSIEKLIKLLISEVRPLALNKKISINFQAQDSFPDVPVDQNLFRQVIHNLITNAIRYSPEKIGKIDIKLEKGDGRFIISVADNGIGIPEKVKNRMFNKFFRADNAVRIATEGTGLGLYVSKLIIESSGGKIWFESSEGSGTTFFVTMPLRGMPEKKGERGLMIS